MQTAIDIDSIEAGRELDAVVAKRVMGWILPRYSGVVGQMWVELPGGQEHPLGPPHFSTDIADAWQVVEKMRTTPIVFDDGTTIPGYYLKLVANWSTTEDSGVFAYFDWQGTGDGNPLYKGQGDTPALAICRAALKAVLASQDVKRDVKPAD